MTDAQIVKEISDTLKSDVLTHEKYDIREYALDLLLVLEGMILQLDGKPEASEQ